MNSMHGCAETSETDRPYLHSMGPLDGSQTMQAGLARGALFGIVGNTDHHSAFPGSYGHGRMAAYAARRDRPAIWDAMNARRTNALTGDSIHLMAAIGSTMQGGVMPPTTDADLRIEAVAGGFIDTIDVIRNGALIHRISPDLAPAPISAEPETLLHLELGWGARGRSFAWNGRIGIDGGEILSVEPRLRGAEIVSPLEGDDAAHALPKIEADSSGAVRFSIIAEANPNNVTPATQGLMLRIRAGDTATVHAEFPGSSIRIPLAELFRHARSGNLGPIDSPAWRIHALPRPEQWQWQGVVPLGDVRAGETVYLRLRQRGGQMAWTSPIFCRD